jgi:hypothetical protein
MVKRRWIGILAVGLIVLAGFAAGSLAQRPSQPPPLLPLNVQEAQRGPKSADPMIDIETFLDRNRKEADAAILALSEESEALRNRLQKVEAALDRWQSVANALNQETGTATHQQPGVILSTPPAVSPNPKAAKPGGRARWRQPEPSPAKNPADPKNPAEGGQPRHPDDDPPREEPLTLPKP